MTDIWICLVLDQQTDPYVIELQMDIEEFINLDK